MPGCQHTHTLCGGLRRGQTDPRCPPLRRRLFVPLRTRSATGAWGPRSIMTALVPSRKSSAAGRRARAGTEGLLLLRPSGNNKVDCCCDCPLWRWRIRAQWARSSAGAVGAVELLRAARGNATLAGGALGGSWRGESEINKIGKRPGGGQKGRLLTRLEGHCLCLCCVGRWGRHEGQPTRLHAS